MPGVRSFLPFGDGSRQFNRAPSPLLARMMPWASVMLASVLPGLPFIASAPIVPPHGFLMLLAWRQLRPGLLPVWAGLPLGLVDDLFSGQPMGSAVLLWSITMVAMEVIEHRYPWRSVIIDWLLATALISGYLIISMMLAHAHQDVMAMLPVLVPGWLLSVLLYPLVDRLVAWLDKYRLTRFRVLR